MKKSLIALAVLAASGAAMAQSSVTLYGVLDTYLGYQTIENSGNKSVASVSTTVLNSGSINGSRWGLKGSEDLGGGLSAIFDLQSGFNLDTGASGQGGLLFGRQAMVGLQGGFGTAKVGRVILPFYDYEGKNDALMNASFSAQSNAMRTANTWSNSGLTGAFETSALGGYVLRGNNGIRYDTPNFSGFVGSLAYAMNEKSVGTPEVFSAALVYDNGPISGVLAYQKEEAYQPAGAGTAPGYAGTTAKDRSYFRLSGQYDFGTIIAKAGYGNVDNVNYMSDAKTDEYQVGLDYKLSPAVLLSAGFAQSKDDATNTVGEVKRSAYSLGGKYTLSKRTFVYGGWEDGKQELDGKPDAKESIFAVGLQHRF